MTRVAAIDCGTNSIRLLIADVEPADVEPANVEPADVELADVELADVEPGGGRLTDVVRIMEVVRLGEGVDQTGRLSQEALRRTLGATHRYAARCAELGVERVRFVATSASRDVQNRDEFVDGVRAAIGVEPEVITGDEEADLSFQGALSAIHGAHRRPYLVVDIGGGSTEFALGADRVAAALSVDIGCVRLTERHLAADPPTPGQIAAARVDISAALDEAGRVVPFGRAGTLVGLAGTVTTVTARALRLAEYDPARIDGTLLRPAAVLDAARDLLQMTRAERHAEPYMHPGRADVIGAGALIWSEIVSRVGAEVARAGGRLEEVLTSEHDILDGIALALA